MDLKEIKKLLDILSRSDVLEMEIEEEGKHLRIRFKEAEVRRELIPVAAPAHQVNPLQVPPEAAPSSGEGEKAGTAAPEGTRVFNSPMVGTFYRAPAPGADPFVKKGDKVSAGTTLCIIEAMKIMNEIKAEEDVEIVDILVENEEPVEFGQPLFILRPL